MNPDIVVGVDGSPESHAAARWATDEARRTGATLHVVYAFHDPWPGVVFDDSPDLAAEAEKHAERLVSRIVQELRDWAPGVRIIGSAVRGRPATLLLDLAARSRLLVVGNRGAGGFSSLLLGSVSQQVATHAAVPVAVIRGHDDDVERPVVVGVDGSASATRALGTALAYAAARSVELVAVRAYPLPGATGHTGTRPDEVEAKEWTALDADLTGWREKEPRVPVRPVVMAGDAAEVLVERSHTAQLVVIGSRGHGGLAGLVLGSVGQKLCHHAQCPVLIVRDSPGG